MGQVRPHPLNMNIPSPGSPRYLVEAASGVFTGSVFHDGRILRAGHLGEARAFKDGTTILQKTHHLALRSRRKVITKQGVCAGSKPPCFPYPGH